MRSFERAIAVVAAAAVMFFCQDSYAATPEALGMQPLAVSPSLGPYVAVKTPFYPCVAVAGATGDMNERVFVCMVDSAGNELWRQTFSTFPGSQRYGSHYVNSLIALDDGGFLVAGSRNVYGASAGRDAWVLRMDRSGGELWCTVIPDSGTAAGHGYSVRCVSAIGAGLFAIAGSKDNGAWLAGMDRAGKVLWSYNCDGSVIQSVTAHPDGGILAVSSSGSASLSTIYISHVLCDGTYRWMHSASFSPLIGAPVFAPLICVTENLTVCAAFGVSQTRFEVMVLDTAANSLWEQQVCLCASGYRSLSSLVPDGSSGILVGGYGAPDQYTAAQNSWLVRLLPNGDIAWQWSTADAQILHAVVADDDGRLTFLGEKYTATSSELVLMNLIDNSAISPITKVRSAHAPYPARFAVALGAKLFDVRGRLMTRGRGFSSGVCVAGRLLVSHAK